jgi:hypothetical protein
VEAMAMARGGICDFRGAGGDKESEEGVEAVMAAGG